MPENVNVSALASAPESAKPDSRETMIKVSHVSMVFNMASEQLGSLKEYFIQIARRKLFFKSFTALDDISFEVKKGDVFGIIGTNGSGKSTLLKIVAGVLEPSKGSCEIHGDIAPLIELGAGFDTELSARENIYLNGALLGYSKNFIDEHFDEIVDFAEVEKFLDMPLKNYSSGMVARIAFAIATVIVPEILVVDEVLSVGDFMFQKKCEDRIAELIDRHGVTVLIVSHSNDQIARLCNKAIWIEKGHTRLLGSAKSVCRIYGGLGGRTGSSESESRVFGALCRLNEREEADDSQDSDGSEESKKFEDLAVRIVGENAESTNAKMAFRAWKGRPMLCAVIACGTTHINAVMANALAAAYAAPVLTTKADELPDAVERVLYDFKPETIMTVDCGSSMRRSFAELSDLPWNPRIVEFRKDNGYQLSRYVFEYGIAQGLWKEEAALLSFDDNAPSLAAAPFLYGKTCPAIIVGGTAEDQGGSLVDYLCERGVRRVHVFGPTVSSSVDGLLENRGLEVIRVGRGGTAQACLEICEYVFRSMELEVGEGSSLAKEEDSGLGVGAEPDRPSDQGLDAETASDDALRELCVATTSLAQWPELLSCGCYAGKRKTALLLLDQTNLDSVSACLDFVKARCGRIGRLISVGGQAGLSDLDLGLLRGELVCREPSRVGR